MSKLRSPDILKAHASDILHRIQRKLRVRRQHRSIARSGLFDANWYLARYPDVALSGVDPLAHYLRHGAAEGRDPNPFFDTDWYLAHNPDVLLAGVNPLVHYLKCGAGEGRDPSRLFRSAAYLEAHRDVARAGVNPLGHYLISGRNEGRRISGTSPKAIPRGPASVPHQGDKQIPPIESEPLPARAAVRQAQSAPQRRPLVSIIVLNRNGAALLDAMFASFNATNTYPHYEFVVVDHSSTDDSLGLLEQWSQLLPVRVVALDRNRSFSYSNNLAAGIAKGELLLLLNNDIVFAQDTLNSMVAALEAGHTGAVGLKQYSGELVSLEPRPISHIGIRFHWHADGRFLQPRNQTGGTLDRILESSLASFPAVTAAFLLCRKEDYLSVGGLDEGYAYGYEDVDFCCKLRFGLQKEIVSLNAAYAIHNESTTRKKDPSAEIVKQRLANRDRLKRRFGYRLRREFTQRLFDDDGSFTGRQVKVGIAVTTLDLAKGAGDLYTAFGLGDALNDTFGWQMVYLPAGSWYDASDLDVYIAMRDDVDIRQLTSAEPHLLTVAWMRNWLERWSVHPWTELYDIHLCSSQYGLDYLWQTRRLRGHLFPIAASLKLFNLGPVRSDYEADVVFTGNYWKSASPREIEAFEPATTAAKFAIYGKSWDAHPYLAPYHRGFIDYSDLAKVYNSAKLTIDDTVTHVTKLWGSLNSRVFEALASGSLVLTNNAIGAAELFGSALPVWNDAADLRGLVNHYLNNPTERNELVDSLRQDVVKNHSYTARARTLRRLLGETVERLSIAIKCPVPREDEAEAWGDFHFACSLRRALVNQGYNVRIDLLPQWYTPRTMADDVVIVLRGLTSYETSSDQINLCWMISHPDKVTDAELESYDHVFVASESYANLLRGRLQVPTSVLLQCSDPDIFHPPGDAGSIVPEELLFVGSSRRQRRQIVDDCIELGLPLTVYGRDWENLIPLSTVKDTHIPNTELHRHYGTAKIILNDHWPSMAANGFISNRIFDVALSGGFLISDQFSGVEIFGEAVVTYNDKADLVRAYRRWINDEPGRRELANRLRELVLNGHTFAHRAPAISQVIQQCHDGRNDLSDLLRSHPRGLISYQHTGEQA